MYPLKSVREAAEEMNNVAIFGVRKAANASDIPTDRRKGWLVQKRLDPIFHQIRQLRPPEREELDAVIGCRVVRGGDHNAEVRTDRVDEIGKRRGRNNSRVLDVPSRTCKSRSNRSSQKFAGYPWVACNNSNRPTVGSANLLSVPPLCQHGGGGPREAQRNVCGELTVRESANTVRSEKPSHSRGAHSL